LLKANAKVMPDLYSPILWISYSLSNLLGILIMWCALKRPMWARLLLMLLFGWAAWLNYDVAHQHPSVYLNYSHYGTGWYSGFIMGWFSRHITPMITMIVGGQVAIAVGIALKGWWVKLACIGIILFMTAIAPLGFAAAFPFSLTLSAAAYLIFNQKHNPYLHELGKLKTTAPPLK